MGKLSLLFLLFASSAFGLTWLFDIYIICALIFTDIRIKKVVAVTVAPLALFLILASILGSRFDIEKVLVITRWIMYPLYIKRFTLKSERIIGLLLLFQVGLQLCQSSGYFLPLNGINWFSKGEPGYGGIFRYTLHSAIFGFFSIVILPKRLKILRGIGLLIVSLSGSLFYMLLSLVYLLFRKRDRMLWLLGIFVAILVLRDTISTMLFESLIFGRIGVIFSVLIFLQRAPIIQSIFGLGYSDERIATVFEALHIPMSHVVLNDPSIGLEDSILFGGVVLFGLIGWILLVRFVFSVTELKLFSPLSLVFLSALMVNQVLFIPLWVYLYLVTVEHVRNRGFF